MRTFGVVIGLLVSLTCAGISAAEETKPFNRIVVILDVSGSNRDQIPTYLEKLKAYIDQMAERRIRRYDTPDQFYLIALDSRPEVIWAGTSVDLQRLAAADVERLVEGRRRFQECTDVGGALNLASFKASRDPRPTAKFLVIFSDLIDEPLRQDGTGCRPVKRPSPPPDVVRWDRLADVTITAFGVPDAEIMAWQEPLDQMGVQITFYNAAEMQNISLQAPQAAVVEATPEDRAKAVRLVTMAWSMVWRGLLWSVGVVAVLLGALYLVRAYRLRGERVSTNQGG